MDIAFLSFISTNILTCSTVVVVVVVPSANGRISSEAKRVQKGTERGARAPAAVIIRVITTVTATVGRKLMELFSLSLRLQSP